jgi:hypothetical protein
MQPTPNNKADVRARRTASAYRIKRRPRRHSPIRRFAGYGIVR